MLAIYEALRRAGKEDKDCAGMISGRPPLAYAISRRGFMLNLAVKHPLYCNGEYVLKPGYLRELQQEFGAEASMLARKVDKEFLEVLGAMPCFRISGAGRPEKNEVEGEGGGEFFVSWEIGKCNGKVIFKASEPFSSSNFQKAYIKKLEKCIGGDIFSENEIEHSKILEICNPEGYVLVMVRSKGDMPEVAKGWQEVSFGKFGLTDYNPGDAVLRLETSASLGNTEGIEAELKKFEKVFGKHSDSPLL